MKPLPNYCLEVNDAVIVVQSCDDERANIGVQWRGKITYCHVALPSLECEWQKWYYNDVRQEIYDMVLRENKSRLLEHIRKLNAAEQCLHLTPRLRRHNWTNHKGAAQVKPAVRPLREGIGEYDKK